MCTFIMIGMVLSLLQAQVSVDWNPETLTATFSENSKPVLVYHQGSTPLPAGIPTEESEHCDYVSHLYGLNGELLTEDYPADHPHHRGINWAWATVQWKGETRDMFWGKGAWARPVRMKETESGNPARLTVENAWKWDDKTPIVRETVEIAVYPENSDGRVVDFDIRLLPLVDDIRFCGRLKRGYSGFNLRMAPAEGQEIVFHRPEQNKSDDGAWADYSALFQNGKRSGVALFQHPDNPGYPQEWREYPELNFFQPVWPGGSLIPMPKDVEIHLQYRLLIHTGSTDPDRMQALWNAYAR